ncbi:hypothetical protein GTQ40_10920 [Flavobacteriaceae bacterium R38]|nr:hypothetical protein [Flavobacteriaceae bacterium R38]
MYNLINSTLIKTYSIIILSLISSSLWGQNFKTVKVQSKNYYTEIDYELINNKIIIPVTIEGKTYRFLLDTGAPNLIRSSLKNIIKTSEVKEITIKDANNKTGDLGITTIPAIEIGGVVFENTTTLVHNIKENDLLFGCLNVDGIIGSNMLQYSIIQILPKERKIKITDTKNKLNLNKKNTLKLKLIGNQASPYIWVNLNGEQKSREQVLFDTGMSGFYDLSKEHHNKYFKENNIYTVLAEGEGTSSISFFGNADETIQYRIQIPEIKIGNALLQNATIQTTDDNNSRIGAELLEYGSVTIDFKKRKFYFDPFQKSINIKEKLLGFSPTVIDNKLVIGIVWDNELKTKISHGDEIIKINGKDIQSIEVCDFITKASIFDTSDSFEIVLKDKEEKLKTIHIEKK